MKVVFTGGGTGGHLFPIIAVARELSKLHGQNSKTDKLKMYYIGPKGDINLDTIRSFSQEGIKMRFIQAGKIRRYGGIAVLHNFLDFFRTFAGVFQAFYHLFVSAPDLIFSKGGYGSLPVVLAGKFLRTPVFLHESDVVQGLANKGLSKFALKIFVSFPYTEDFNSNKMILVGNPVRMNLLGGSKEEAERFLQFTLEKPAILIMGGSQGAQRINNVVLNILPQMLKDFEVFHQTGEKNFKEVRKEAEAMIGTNKEIKKYYHPFPFLDEKYLKAVYTLSDIIVSRAGSGSIFEIAALNKPSILIPLPESAQDHQVKNAYSYARNKATVVLEELNLTPHFFLQVIKNIVSNPEDVQRMKEATQSFAKPEAAKVIARYLLDFFYK